MFGIRDRKSFWVVVGLVGLFLIFSIFVAPRFNPPRPETHSYLIDDGGVSRFLMGAKYPQTSRPGTFVPPYRPHHIEFTSSNGPIDVCVVPYSATDVEAEIERMNRLTKQLEAGQRLEGCLAEGTGVRGTIDLPGWWPFGWAKSFVFVRSQNESEVQIVVHYGPSSTGTAAAGE